jgi:succinoglycan biosynthesis transport protein ExoP
MDTIDSPESNLPSPLPPPSRLLPALPQAFSDDLAFAPAPQFNSQTLLRGLVRHWWQILLIWLVVAVPVVALIYLYVEPTFEAFSTLQVEPVSQRLFHENASENVDSRGVTLYLQTQVGLLTSDRVLLAAITDPRVVNLSAIKESDDPKTVLRKEMVVEIVKDAYLIRVALELPDPNQAAAIVNAVVRSYLAYNSEYQRGRNSTLRANLIAEQERIQKEIKEKRAELANLVNKGTVTTQKLVLNRAKTSADDDDSPQPTFTSNTEGQRQRLADEMLSKDLEISKTVSNINAMKEAIRQTAVNQNGSTKLQEEQRDQQIEDDFKKDPEVIALTDEIALAQERRDHAKSLARQAHDPARRAAEQHYKKLMEQYDKLWDAKYKEFSARLKNTSIEVRPEQSVTDLEIKLKSLKDQKLRLIEMFDKMKVEEKTGNNDTFEATFLSRQLDTAQRDAERLNNNIKELQFKASQEDFRVSQVDQAIARQVPTNNKRLKYVAAVPICLLLMVLGLFFLLEIKGERVGDPDALSTRVRSEVFALPPLPTARAIRKLSVSEADDQIEEFIQRLDHLRFAVCGNPSELGTGRCVLITSAVGGEGKTTLAAQLAARCGNAGMSTLLIDADLRRAALCPLLDVPEGLGLSDVLKEEATTDEVVIPVQGGTFYLLRAGTPIPDTNRVFQSRQLGALLTQLRQLYDLIIIDSPPVLPVPDALILGRWVDGAVLAARYDISRFPQVERARRQLDNAGIAIMGTVINGMRNSSSYYGRYSYSRRRSSQPSSSDTI